MKKIVTIGGGTGSFTLLRGLKKYPFQLSAIVSMSDNGGSTGVLRDELGVLPPGDVRQCLVALSESPEILRDLMNYRFESGALKGHNFGNLFISAMEKIKGDFSSGVEEAAKILNVKGEVIPVTNQDANLCMELKNGKILNGEKEVTLCKSIKKSGVRRFHLKPNVKANAKAIRRILEADMVIIGPGNHYSSIVPNLLVDGIAKAIRETKAEILYNCNMANIGGQTDGFTLDDYVDSINSYIGSNRVDYVIYNTKKPSEKLIERYASQKELLVKFDEKDRSKRNYKIIKSDILSRTKPKFSKADAIASRRSLIRHDSDKLAKIIALIFDLKNYESIINGII